MNADTLVIDKVIPRSLSLKYTNVLVGTPGQGTVISAVLHKVPLVPIPVIADQQTHGLRVNYFDIGRHLFKISFARLSDTDFFLNLLARKDTVEKVSRGVIGELNRRPSAAPVRLHRKIQASLDRQKRIFSEEFD